MHKSFLLLFILFSSSLFAQWTSLNPHPSPNTSYIGSAPSSDRFITVTGQGEAIVTHNGGSTWSVVPIGGDGIYRSTYFLSDNLGWAVGSYVERLHKTTDGGLTWTHQPNAPDTTKYDVFFISQDIGWSVGFNGFIIKTTNGGDQWFSQSNTSVTNKTLYGVNGTDVNNIYVVGNGDVILKSTDGGNTFTNYSTLVFGNLTDYRGIYFPPSGTGNTGFICGSKSRIAKTVDGGANWTSVNNPGGTVQLWTIDFNSLGVGLASGASSQIWRTTDNGDTWSLVTGFPSSITFYSVRFGSDNIAYASGSSGYIFKSTDAGATWFELSRRSFTNALNDVSFADDSIGYVVGGTGFIAKTTNGGYSWTQQTSPWSADINEVVAPTPDFAIAGCDDGNVVRTTDGGANWNLVSTGMGTAGEILAIDFINSNYGLAVGYDGNVARSTDGGATWTLVGMISGGNPWDMDMIDSNYAWVAATGERIFRTTDAGATWEQQLAMGGLGTYGISFINREYGVAGGTSGNTYYTTNGGANWTSALQPPDQTVWGIKYVPSPFGNFAMTACASGYAYISRDSGKTWTAEPRMTINTFDDIYMTDAANAWLVGSGGVVIKYYEPDNIPVELTSFSASILGNDVMLNWTTASEINNAGFIIERKQTGSWTEIAKIQGNGTTTNISNYSYLDEGLNSGLYYYRIKQVDYSGTSKYYELQEAVNVTAPNVFYLTQNYPNPFNPSTVINYNLPVDAQVMLKVYDILGNEVAVLINEFKTAGQYQKSISVNELGNIPSGVYFYTLNAGSFNQTKKMMILK